MASFDRSPKRQRLSLPSDDIPGLTLSVPNTAHELAQSSEETHQAPAGTAAGADASHNTHETAPPQPTTSIEPLHPSRPSEGARLSDLKGEDVEMRNSGDHRRTDHERKERLQPSATANLPLACQKAHPRSRPHPSQNLIGTYSLSALAATVARRDPATGAKINKLRKSYEGKVKKQELPGRNKPTVLPGELMGFMEWPEEGWFDQRIYGRELEYALDPKRGRLFRSDDNEGGKSKLTRSLELNIGRFPKEEDDKWRAALALDEPATIPPAKPSVVSATAIPHGLKTGGLGTGMRASAPASPAGSLSRSSDRPDRAGKKRRYDDASFEGYDNGWAEDDGYSTGNDRNGAGRQGKRRREFEHSQTAAPTPSSGGHGHGHFGTSSSGSNNMVGVRSS